MFESRLHASDVRRVTAVVERILADLRIEHTDLLASAVVPAQKDVRERGAGDRIDAGSFAREGPDSPPEPVR